MIWSTSFDTFISAGEIECRIKRPKPHPFLPLYMILPEPRDRFLLYRQLALLLHPPTVHYIYLFRTFTLRRSYCLQKHNQIRYCDLRRRVYYLNVFTSLAFFFWLLLYPFMTRVKVTSSTKISIFHGGHIERTVMFVLIPMSQSLGSCNNNSCVNPVLLCSDQSNVSSNCSNTYTPRKLSWKD